jgi:chromosome partitioning protein
MQTIVIANNKGGVGKSTTALALADVFMKKGKKVLFIDTDPQGNSSATYHAVIDGESTLYDLLEGECSAEEAVQHTDIGDIIASDPALAGVQMKYTSRPANLVTLKKALKEIEEKSDYDYCIIDTAPTLEFYTSMALFAADGVIIPVSADIYALGGLNTILGFINQVKDAFNDRLKVYGVFITAYDQRTALGRDCKENLPIKGKELGFHVFAPVRTCQDVKNAQAAGMMLLDYAPGCNAADDYRVLANEIIKRYGK